MKVRATLLAAICASAIACPAFAQEATDDDLENPNFGQNVIVVTAQRQAQPYRTFLSPNRTSPP